MSVTKEQVAATAALARIDLSRSEGADNEAELDRIAAHLDAIVGYVDILNQVDTAGIVPMYSPMEETAAPPREDTACQRLTVEELLENAPRRQDRFFAVPPVI